MKKIYKCQICTCFTMLTGFQKSIDQDVLSGRRRCHLFRNCHEFKTISTHGHRVHPTSDFCWRNSSHIFQGNRNIFINNLIFQKSCIFDYLLLIIYYITESLIGMWIGMVHEQKSHWSERKGRQKRRSQRFALLLRRLWNTAGIRAHHWRWATFS